MTFKPAIWYPIAVLLSVGNLVALWFAAGPTEPWHATMHGVLAVASGVWALRLRQRRGGSERKVGREAVEALDALEALEAEMSTLRQELIETQERLDFAERMLAQVPEAHRVRPQP